MVVFFKTVFSCGNSELCMEFTEIFTADSREGGLTRYKIKKKKKKKIIEKYTSDPCNCSKMPVLGSGIILPLCNGFILINKPPGPSIHASDALILTKTPQSIGST